MALGKNIAAFRARREWTLDALSQASEVDVGTIHALEKRDSSRSVHAVKLAAAFGVSVEQLIAVFLRLNFLQLLTGKNLQL